MASAPVRSSFPSRLRIASALLLVACLAAGCVSELERARAGSVSPATLALMDRRDMKRDAPILVRVFKESSELEIWKQDRSGRYGLLKSYPVCRYSGTLGPKKQEGDYQAPEGFYDVRLGQMNPHSIEYLSFNVGYPNAYDRALGRTGDSLMIHGGCRSVGCYAMTDAQIDEIYALAYASFSGGQTDIQIQAYPFRMNAANLDRHKDDPNMPFWQMLKRGHDLFEATSLPPQVAVCDKQYAFASGESGDAPSGPSCTLAL